MGTSHYVLWLFRDGSRRFLEQWFAADFRGKKVAVYGDLRCLWAGFHGCWSWVFGGCLEEGSVFFLWRWEAVLFWSMCECISLFNLRDIDSSKIYVLVLFQLKEMRGPPLFFPFLSVPPPLALYCIYVYRSVSIWSARQEERTKCEENMWWKSVHVRNSKVCY